MKLAPRRTASLCGAVIVLLMVSGAAVGAATPKIDAPASPYTVQVGAGGKLEPFTIRVSGFKPGQQVFVEQCDGNAVSTPNWTPNIDCDVGTSPAPVFTPQSGVVVFDASDLNHRFTPVSGLSPEGNFACFTDTSPKGVPHFDSCQVRISTNNTQATTDQVFLDIVLAGHAGASTAAASSSSGSSGSSSAVVFVVIGVVVVVLLGGALTLRGRRARTA